MKEKAIYKKAKSPGEKVTTLYSKARKGGQKKPANAGKAGGKCSYK